MHSAYTEAFSLWCLRSRGGPAEVFREIDLEGSGTVSQCEFVKGLTALGFFDDETIPEGIRTEELLLKNLYPLIVTGHCISIDDVLFLEKDKVKRAKIIRQLQRIRDQGIEAGPEPLRNEGQRMLFKLSMSTTQLGGKHWKGVKSKVARGAGNMPGSPNFRPNLTWLEQISLARAPKARETGQASSLFHSFRSHGTSGVCNGIYVLVGLGRKGFSEFLRVWGWLWLKGDGRFGKSLENGRLPRVVSRHNRGNAQTACCPAYLWLFVNDLQITGRSIVFRPCVQLIWAP
ncbi:unnamed protein product [Symbiodinium natans]|uniref:EF-hand domain-containing protein n=1 Tax=Symbiodinium natans TaxID=878477 RepID=A0A812SYY1_9DINO|nr:unnamed protein product [Symbiodinium natans]